MAPMLSAVMLSRAVCAVPPPPGWGRASSLRVLQHPQNLAVPSESTSNLRILQYPQNLAAQMGASQGLTLPPRADEAGAGAGPPHTLQAAVPSPPSLAHLQVEGGWRDILPDLGLYPLDPVGGTACTACDVCIAHGAPGWRVGWRRCRHSVLPVGVGEGEWERAWNFGGAEAGS